MPEKIPNISIDCVIFGYHNNELQALLIKRDKEPNINEWSLPGSYINMDETMKDAAQRILEELTGINNIFLSQVGVFDQLDRYPTHRLVSVLYCALIKPEMVQLLAGSHAKEVNWFHLSDIGSLPFDHNQMIEASLRWLKKEVWQKPILVNLLPQQFPLNQLLELYQFILQSPIDNRNFRKKMVSQELVEKTEAKTSGGRQRPAHLYRFKTPE